MQSTRIRSLDEYLHEEVLTRERNSLAFDLEFELASIVFRAAQEAYTSYPILVDATPHRAKCSLVLTIIRYYATAVDLCMRGNGAEAMGVMHSAIECAAYAMKVKSEPALVNDWVDLDEKTPRQRRDLFGSDATLVRGLGNDKITEFYEMLSEFGVHARFMLAEQATDFDHPTGWRIRHAEHDSDHVRWALLGIIFVMKNLVTDAIAPLYLDTPWPQHLTKTLESYEEKRKDLGRHRPRFLKWIKDPKRPESYQGRVIPARDFWAVDNPASPDS